MVSGPSGFLPVSMDALLRTSNFQANKGGLLEDCALIVMCCSPTSASFLVLAFSQMGSHALKFDLMDSLDAVKSRCVDAYCGATPRVIEDLL